MAAKLKKLKRSAPKPNTSADGKKKQRGPKAYIATPSAATYDDDEDSEGGEAMEAALEAEAMAAGADYDDSSADDSDGDDHPKKQPTAVAKGKRKAESNAAAGPSRSADFLLNLDQKGIGRSRAEELRLKKAERKIQQSEAAESSSRAQQAAEDSDGASTDMEGASESEGSSNGLGDEEDDFADLLSDDEDFDSEAGFTASDVDDEDSEESSSDEDGDKAERKHAERMKIRRKREQVDATQQAESSKRKRLPVRNEGEWKEEDSENEDAEASSEKLPKRVKKANRVTHDVHLSDVPSSEDDEPRQKTAREPEIPSTILSGARFGMQAPYSIMVIKSKRDRVGAAKNQIARLASDIMGDPEMSLGMLRRLTVFAQSSIQRPEADAMARANNLPTWIDVDDTIRGAALLSLTRIYDDILPGYRIRALSEKEQSEKVNQETQRRREYEQGLVEVYRSHLEICEKVLRSKTSLSTIALKAMCHLLTRATHFNYRTNLIGALVSFLSRKSWNDDSQACADALVEVLRRDLGGDVSLEVVRLLNRMIKERHFKVNAKVLNILLHLRLKDEVGGRRSNTVRADREKKSEASTKQERNGKSFKSGKGKAKPKDVRKGQGEHLSKKTVKKLREIKEVEKDMREAEAEVDKEEKERNHTETLKLLFVLYFSILKSDEAPGPLLGAALEGLARFAHRVNVDFFRDLLAVLRRHVEDARAGAIARNVELKADVAEDGEEQEIDPEPEQDDLRKALLCLATAFELLSGQGEALNIDLSDMVSHLYAILIPLCASPSIEEVPVLPVSQAPAADQKNGKKTGPAPSNTHLLRTDADLLLRALDLCLLRPRLADLPSERSAAFVKRLLLCSLHTPPQTTLRLLGVVRAMIGKDPKLEAMLDTDDRAVNGSFDLVQDEVERARPLAAGQVGWELHTLRGHVNEDVASAARAILAWQV